MMHLLDPQEYFKVTAPLQKVTINTFFARAVVEGHVDGWVYVDNLIEPKTIHVVHPYGMSLLFGESGNQKFNAAFRNYVLNVTKPKTNYEWMQAFPESWDETLRNLFKHLLVNVEDNSENRNIVELNTRVNFKFNAKKFRETRVTDLPENVKVVRTDKELFSKMKGSVVPEYFWKDAEDFYANGIGFSVLSDEQLASTAYSAFILGNGLEIGIETVEAFRGRGFAYHSCAALIDYCLERNFEPVWACRLANKGSFQLALKLGFEVEKLIPYYRLCK